MSDDIVTQLLEQNDMLQVQLKQKQEIIEKLSRENQSLKSANQNLLKVLSLSLILASRLARNIWQNPRIWLQCTSTH